MQACCWLAWGDISRLPRMFFDRGRTVFCNTGSVSVVLTEQAPLQPLEWAEFYPISVLLNF
jgi:hypothetical protein